MRLAELARVFVPDFGYNAFYGASLRIAMIASEAVPYAKTGGLADVVGSLPTPCASWA